MGNFNFFLFRRKTFFPSKVKALIEFFKQEKVTHVIVTGDLSSTSQDVEFKMARELILSFEKEGMEVFVIPGNHDVYTKKAERLKRFFDYFPPKKSENAFCLKKDGLSLHFLDKEKKKPLILLNTAKANNLISAEGLFNVDLELKLKNLLDSLPKDSNILIANHYPPFERPHKIHNLLRKEELLKILKNRPNLLFYLNGHTHVHAIADLRKAGLPIFLDAGSTAESGSYWNLIDFETKTLSAYTSKSFTNWSLFKTISF